MAHDHRDITLIQDLIDLTYNNKVVWEDIGDEHFSTRVGDVSLTVSCVSLTLFKQNDMPSSTTNSTKIICETVESLHTSVVRQQKHLYPKESEKIRAEKEKLVSGVLETTSRMRQELEIAQKNSP